MACLGEMDVFQYGCDIGVCVHAHLCMDSCARTFGRGCVYDQGSPEIHVLSAMISNILMCVILETTFVSP